MVVLFVSGSLFLYSRKPSPEPPPMPEPPILTQPPVITPILPEHELARVRQSTTDADPAVRWAAIELLFTLKDPNASDVIERVITQDTDPEIKAKTIRLVKEKGDDARVGYLVKALKDSDKSVRIAALTALGDIGDPASAPWVTEALQDYEPEVKVQALRALGKYQEKHIAEFNALAEKLRKDYEEALKKRKDKKKGLFTEVNEGLNPKK